MRRLAFEPPIDVVRAVASDVVRQIDWLFLSRTPGFYPVPAYAAWAIARIPGAIADIMLSFNPAIRWTVEISQHDVHGGAAPRPAYDVPPPFFTTSDILVTLARRD